MRLTLTPSRAVGAALLAIGCASTPHQRTAPAAPGAPAAASTRPADAVGGHVLTGVVRDARSDALLAEASVILVADGGREISPARGAVTDRQGRYRVDSIQTGSYRVRVQRVGYHPDTVRVQVGDCGYVVVVSGRAVSHCEDSRNFYIVPASRF